MEIDFIEELTLDRKRNLVSCTDLVVDLSKKYKLPQYKVKELLESFLNQAFSLRISLHRTSEIFLKGHDRKRCPMHKGFYISHLDVRRLIILRDESSTNS